MRSLPWLSQWRRLTCGKHDGRTRSFKADVIGQLGFYVYRVVHPRDGRTFYVGKGVRNRVFAYVSGDVPEDGAPLPAKSATIREIRGAGLAVKHHIHRHRLDEATVIHVEAALIDAYSDLTNLVRGRRSDDLGTALSRRSSPETRHRQGNSATTCCWSE